MQVIDAEKQLHEDSGFLKQQLDALLQVHMPCERAAGRFMDSSWWCWVCKRVHLRRKAVDKFASGQALSVILPAGASHLP